MHNLVQYSDTYLKTSRNSWQYYRDEPALNDNSIISNFPNDSNRQRKQTSENIFTYIKKNGETILAKIWKLEKTMIKYSSYTNHLRFSVCSHHNKILPKDLQLKSRIKTKRSKIILQRAGKLLLQERVYQSCYT